MADYSRLDPYSRSRYDNGIDAKIVIMGNTGVGKTSLLQRYTQNKFEPKLTTSTTGAFFVTKKAYIQGLKVRMQLWDTAGQERFRSMAPMYYRGANAALLLYDITSAESFDDVRGWLEELKKNCTSELIIYIVGAKADLYRQRQVTSDQARLYLHRWFPPPRPDPIPAPPAPSSTLSYIRPRFTSFTASRSAPQAEVVAKALDDQALVTGSALRRSNTGIPIQRPSASPISRANSANASTSPRQRQLFPATFGQFGFQTGRLDDSPGGSSQGVIEEDEEEDDREWGLEKGMSLFEVSAKDDLGVKALFDSVMTAIVARKDAIERENDRKRRESVMLTPVMTPAWASQADEEEKALAKAKSGYSCCST